MTLGGGGFRGLGGRGGAPRDLLILLGVLFVTFSLQFFAATAIVPALLRLTTLVWRGFLWQLATYPFIGYGPPSLWILIELFILFWFGRDVYYGLGRRHFWRLLAWAAVGAGLLAVVVQLLLDLPVGRDELVPLAAHFSLMQGQRVLLAIVIAAFATANRRATILLFFILPIEARWFLGLEILFAFIGFLSTHDFAGFLGICAAVGIAFLYVRDGGLGRGLRQTRLRLTRRWLQFKLDRARRRRGLHVIKGSGGDDLRGEPGEPGRGPWLHRGRLFNREAPFADARLGVPGRS
ncbi:MAG TPA: hypothetical protein VHR45_22750 [Thermoanaerobaculia bacterium]|nr:hypothetical protein [Thermoanaerobaculia bacterium]